MLRTARTAAALLGAAALTTGAPAHAQGAGTTCGLFAATDPTGLINQDPNVANGVMWAAYADPMDNLPGGSTVVIDCWVQVGTATPVGPSIPSAALTASGPRAAALSGAVTFVVGPADTVYVCTRVRSATYTMLSNPCTRAIPAVVFGTARAYLA